MLKPFSLYNTNLQEQNNTFGNFQLRTWSKDVRNNTKYEYFSKRLCFFNMLIPIWQRPRTLIATACMLFQQHEVCRFTASNCVHAFSTARCFRWMRRRFTASNCVHAFSTARGLSFNAASHTASLHCFELHSGRQAAPEGALCGSSIHIYIYTRFAYGALRRLWSRAKWSSKQWSDFEFKESLVFSKQACLSSDFEQTSS